MSDDRRSKLNSGAIVAGAIFISSALFYSGGTISRQTEQIASMDRNVIRLEQRVGELEKRVADLEQSKSFGKN